MAGEVEVVECGGCGGDTLLEPAWDDVDSPQPWRGGMRLMIVDGRLRLVHEYPDCVSCASEVWS
jgi:hypothetical protein